MINYICAALCGLCALLLVVILRQRRKILFLRQIVDQAADESARKLIRRDRVQTVGREM